MAIKFPKIAQQLIALRDADLTLRERLLRSGQANGTYHPEMEAMHQYHADLLEEILDRIGYPGTEKVGAEANEAAWLIVQHAIGRPAFQRNYLALLEQAGEETAPRQLAYLSDRIAVFEGRPQRYGTQFDWDEEGQLSPQPVDDPAAVDRRRAVLGLPSLAVQTLRIRARARDEGESAPADLPRYHREQEAWRRSVGWIS